MLCCGFSFSKEDEVMGKKAFKANIHLTLLLKKQQILTSMFYLTGCLDKCSAAGGDDCLKHLLLKSSAVKNDHFHGSS